MDKRSLNNILIVVLIILVIGLTCFIVYDKLFSSSNDEDMIDNNNNGLKENTLKNNDFISMFAGKYQWEKVFDVENSENGGYCKSFESFELSEDGTYTYQGGETCGSGQNAIGKYSIGKDKIYLFNDNCKIVSIGDSCEYPNCSPIFEFNYTIANDEVKIFTDNNVQLEKK